MIKKISIFSISLLTSLCIACNGKEQKSTEEKVIDNITYSASPAKPDSGNEFPSDSDKKTETQELLQIEDRSFSFDKHYTTSLSCTFGGMDIMDGKVTYAAGTTIDPDSDFKRAPSEVAYEFIHIDGMPFIKMEKPFPKEFLSDYANYGADANPDDKMLFLVCKTRDLGIQALGITRANDSSFMIIEPRWLEMSSRIYKDETSHLVEKNGKEYPVKNLCEMDSETPWVEGAPGYGIGESFVLENTWGTVYKTLLIMNGYISYERPYLYKQNGRIKKIKVAGVKSGKEKILDVLDTPHPQSIDIGFITEAEDLRITIENVYPGTKYEDTCIHFMINSMEEVAPYELSIK